MTMIAPAAPKLLPTRISSMARSASEVSVQMRTPLPNASPSALTAQRPFRDAAKALAAAASEKVPARAVGMPCFSMKICEKTLEDSNCAALRFGPQMRNRCSWKRSTIPRARGLSGPTTVRSGFFSWAKASNLGRYTAPMGMHSSFCPLARDSSATPALPGAHHNCLTWGDWASFQTRACSRPPEPIIKSFIRRKCRKTLPQINADEYRWERQAVEEMRHLSLTLSPPPWRRGNQRQQARGQSATTLSQRHADSPNREKKVSPFP